MQIRGNEISRKVRQPAAARGESSSSSYDNLRSSSNGTEYSEQKTCFKEQVHELGTEHPNFVVGCLGLLCPPSDAMNNEPPPSMGCRCCGSVLTSGELPASFRGEQRARCEPVFLGGREVVRSGVHSIVRCSWSVCANAETEMDLPHGVAAMLLPTGYAIAHVL